MAMGTRKQREKQERLWIAHTELATAPGHPFYQKLNELLEAERFDEFVEQRCAKFYAPQYGRPSLTPGIYFRSRTLCARTLGRPRFGRILDDTIVSLTLSWGGANVRAKFLGDLASLSHSIT